MSLPAKNQFRVAFSTDFNYLHTVKKGVVTTNSSVSIPLPTGMTVAFFRVYTDSSSGGVETVDGYYTNGADAHIENGNLVLTVQHSQDGSPSPTKTFYYFIYGGNYA